MQGQGDWSCSEHPGAEFRRQGVFYTCSGCLLAEKIEQIWANVEVPPLRELVSEVDARITEYLWIWNSGALVNLFLYFQSEAKPLDPREFLEFWGPLSPAEEDYYIAASAEAMRDEAKGA